MTYDPDKVASDWIAYARYRPDEAPDQIFADGWVLYDLVEDDPRLAWEVIKVVVRRYPIQDYYSARKTEAQQVVGNMAAGPLEDLISTRGSEFIDAAEIEAGLDRRMAWTLGGMWQSTTPDEIWHRVQQVADYAYWKR